MIVCLKGKREENRGNFWNSELDRRSFYIVLFFGLSLILVCSFWIRRVVELAIIIRNFITGHS